jgi:predicted nucleotidyltransferase
MVRIPDTPEEIFDEFSKDYREAYGDGLQSILLYGSGAKGQYVARQSDLNFLVILREDGIDHLDRALTLVEKWRKRNVAVPLFLTREYIESALDTFPIEFLDMRNFHTVVYGEDILDGLEIQKADLRRQIERELRSKLVYLRTGFLRSGLDREALRDMVAASVPTFAAIFAALLFLKGEAVPLSRSEVIRRVCELYHIEAGVLGQVANIRTGEWRGSTVQLQELTQLYIAEIRKLISLVDKM